MRRAVVRVAVALSLVAVLTGGGYAYLGYAGAGGPADAVHGYFAALARGDAAAALAFGDVPSGPHEFLTADVLRIQLQIAPFRDVRVGPVDRTGSSARVGVEYRLAFADHADHVSASVRVVRRGAQWRLVQSALSTTISLRRAQDRATFTGAALPDGPILLFPGALPVRFDSALLRLAPGSREAHFGEPDRSGRSVEISPAGQQAIHRALAATLRSCFGPGGSADPSCPLPSGGRYVPASLRGTVRFDHTSASLAGGAGGLIDMVGDVGFEGSYRRLDFDNLPQTGHGRLRLPVDATALPIGRTAIRFRGTP